MKVGMELSTGERAVSNVMQGAHTAYGSSEHGGWDLCMLGNEVHTTH